MAKQWRIVWAGVAVLASAFVLVLVVYGVIRYFQYSKSVSMNVLVALDVKGVAVEFDHRYRGTRAFMVHKVDGDSTVLTSSPFANNDLFTYIQTGDTVEFRGKRDLAVVTRVRGTVVRSDTFRLFAD